MTKEEILNLTIDEAKQLFREYVDSQDLAPGTKNTRMHDAFYLAKHNPSIPFFDLLLSEDFETRAKQELVLVLKQNSKGDIEKNLNSYMSHLRKLKEFLIGENPTPRTRTVHVSKAKNQASSFSANDAVAKINKYYNAIQPEYTRYKSWEHCYNAFKSYRHSEDKVEFLCVHLACYLASWGMLRNSGLINYDYFVHKNFIEQIANPKFDKLYDDNLLENIDLIFEAVEVIKNTYPASISKTDTLITKILLGVFGCVPAYDRYFKLGLRQTGIVPASFTPENIARLFIYYQNNFEEFESLRKSIEKENIHYTPMKLMDMCFWQYGFDVEQTEKTAK